jgi:ribonuclease HI
LNTAPFPLANLSLLKNCWVWIPKLICWNIWLERNGRIFRDSASPPARLAAKVKSQVNELVSSKTLLCNESSPDQITHSWFSEMDPLLMSRIKSSQSVHLPWEIRLEENEFIKWRSTLEKHVLCVDGASKDNPGNAGGGGVLYNPEGNLILSFAWGLGLLSNNSAEYLALWQGLNQARTLRIPKLVVFGDSRIVIQSLVARKRLKHLPLSQLFSRILNLVKEFDQVNFYHVLRRLNHQDDLEAAVGSSLEKGEIKINGRVSLCPIP